MKKIIAILLTLTLMVGLVACSSEADAKKVAEYVDKNGATLIQSMEESFTGSSGMTCSSTIKAEGCGIVMSININELSDVDAATKAQMQAAYDSMDSVFDSMLGMMQQELPELESFTIHVCERDGTRLASIVID